MDNISQEKTKEDVSPKTEEISADSDIQFEEVIDIDKIQKELRLQFGEGTTEEESPVESESAETIDNPIADESTEFSPPQQVAETKSDRLEIDPKDKKYVVYIDYNNIDFMENLSNSERKELINKILKEQNIYASKKKAVDERNHFIKHLITATVTFIIGFPLMFLVVNKATEFTMQNYKEAKSNFSKLYKEQGKIKSGDSSAAVDFKY